MVQIAGRRVVAARLAQPQVRAPLIVVGRIQSQDPRAEAAAILLAQASVCLDLAAKSREFWVTASLVDLARELQNRANQDR